MVQGLINTGMYQAFNKRNGDGDGLPVEVKKSHFVELREWLTKKWKLLISTAILLTSIFTFSGIILYLNLGSSNHCRKGYLNVHIIPYMYSNIDLYIPPRDELFRNELHDSLDFVISELEKDEQRRFTLTETYSLWDWWKKQENSVKMSVRKLIQEGRLEIAGGGCFITAEASVHYTNFIDQFTWGLRYLEEIAGTQVSPDVSFSMDNHGHSREIAYLLKHMDFRAVMLGGVSQYEQCYRRTYQKMEFLWSDREIFETKNEKPNLFASILDSRVLKINNLFEHENPVIDVNELNNVICQAYGYSSNNVFIPVGSHFQLKNIKNIFRVVESIMNLTRYNPAYKLNVIYSTPTYYISSVLKNNERWSRSTGEFLPYSENNLKFWTGYYSSRPSLKFQERLTSRFLQVLKQMLSNSNLGADYSSDFVNLRQAVALSQHHRSVIGIASENTSDYMNKLLHNSFSKTAQAANRALNKFAAKKYDLPVFKYESCLSLNISVCKISEESESFVLTIYNPSNRYINHYVRVPVTRDAYLVRTSDGTSLRTQMVKIPKQILTMPGRKSEAEKELIFKADRIPALGFKSFYITAVGVVNRNESVSAKNISLIINNLTGRIAGIQRNNEIYPMSQELMFYTSWLSGNSVFRPDNRPNIITHDARIELLNDGEFVTEYKQDFASWASQIIRVYKDEDFIEFKWIVGPIPVSFIEGKEVITSFTTNIKNKDSFYTDINGRGLEKKQKGSALENESIGENIAKNYRPVNTQIAITDRDYRLHIFNDRVQGGTSSFEGELQLMLHRRLFGLNLFPKNDDDLNEGVYYTGLIATGEHWVFLGSAKDINLKKSIETFAAGAHWEPWYFFANASRISYEYWTNNYVTEYSGMKKDPPKNLRILTLEPWKEGKILLRLENIGEDGCDRVQVNLQKLFPGFIINKATQVTLAGNYFKRPFTCETKFESNPFVSNDIKNEPVNLQVFIYPFEIKTYILDVTPSH